MKRPTFVTMSTLVFTIVAYCALTQAAHADADVALDLRGWSAEAAGIASHALPLSSQRSGASMRR